MLSSGNNLEFYGVSKVDAENYGSTRDRRKQLARDSKRHRSILERERAEAMYNIAQDKIAGATRDYGGKFCDKETSLQLMLGKMAEVMSISLENEGEYEEEEDPLEALILNRTQTMSTPNLHVFKDTTRVRENGNVGTPEGKRGGAWKENEETKQAGMTLLKSASMTLLKPPTWQYRASGKERRGRGKMLPSLSYTPTTKQRQKMMQSITTHSSVWERSIQRHGARRWAANMRLEPLVANRDAVTHSTFAREIDVAGKIYTVDIKEGNEVVFVDPNGRIVKRLRGPDVTKALDLSEDVEGATVMLLLLPRLQLGSDGVFPEIAPISANDDLRVDQSYTRSRRGGWSEAFTDEGEFFFEYTGSEAVPGDERGKGNEVVDEAPIDLLPLDCRRAKTKRRYMDGRSTEEKTALLQRLFDMAARDFGDAEGEFGNFVASYEAISAAVRGEIIESLFPCHANEIRFIVSQHILRIDPKLGGVRWCEFKDACLELLSEPGGRVFNVEPSLIFEGNHYLHGRVHHVLIQADLDPWGRRAGLVVSATSLSGKTYSAFFSQMEIQSVLGMDSQVPSGRVAEQLLPRLKRVARTLVISHEIPAKGSHSSGQACIEQAAGGALSWEQRFTNDGRAYYVNESTRQVCWEPPVGFEILPPDLRRSRTKRMNTDKREAKEKVALLQRCFNGFKTRPEDAFASVRAITSSIRRHGEVEQSEAAEPYQCPLVNAFPIYQGELKYIASSGILEEIADGAGDGGFVSWGVFERTLMTVLESAGGRTFVSEPAVVYEGTCHISGKNYNVLVQETRDAYGSRTSLNIAAHDVSGRLLTAFFSERELREIFGYGHSTPSTNIVRMLLPCLRRVARTLVVRVGDGEKDAGGGGFRRQQDAWKECFTPDGTLYFVNEKTHEKSWEPPFSYPILPPDLRRNKTKRRYVDHRRANVKEALLRDIFDWLRHKSTESEPENGEESVQYNVILAALEDYADGDGEAAEAEREERVGSGETSGGGNDTAAGFKEKEREEKGEGTNGEGVEGNCPNLFHRYFPAHVAEMRYTLTSGIMQCDDHSGGGVSWNAFKRPFLQVLSAPGGRSFEELPMIVFEGPCHIGNKTFTCVLQEERNAWGIREHMIVTAQNSNGRLHSAVFHAKELESVCEVTSDMPGTEAARIVLNSLRRVARTFVLRPPQPRLKAEQLKELNLEGYSTAVVSSPIRKRGWKGGFGSDSDPTQHWVEHFTEGGFVYYENEVTRERQWHVPDRGLELLPPDLRRSKTKRRMRDRRSAAEKEKLLMRAFARCEEARQREDPSEVINNVIPLDWLELYISRDPGDEGGNAFAEAFPLHINELRFLLANNLIVLRSEGVAWGDFRRVALQVLAAPGGRKFRFEPSIVFEGNASIKGKHFHVSILEERDDINADLRSLVVTAVHQDKGDAVGVSGMGAELSSRTFLATFPFEELYVQLGIQDCPTSQLVNKLLPRLRTVARTLVVGRAMQNTVSAVCFEGKRMIKGRVFTMTVTTQGKHQIAVSAMCKGNAFHGIFSKGEVERAVGIWHGDGDEEAMLVFGERFVNHLRPVARTFVLGSLAEKDCGEEAEGDDNGGKEEKGDDEKRESSTEEETKHGN